MFIETTNHADPLTRMTISLHSSTVAILEAYARFLEATHGGDIGKSQLMEQMLRAVVDGDPDFQEWQSPSGSSYLN